MDEGRNFPLPVTRGWAWEDQVKPAPAANASAGFVNGGADELRTPSGEPVPELICSAYARHRPAVDGELPEAFADAVAVLNAPSEARADLPDPPITVLYDEIWQLHADLRYRFDIDRQSGRFAYLRWLVEVGAPELGIPAVFLNCARSAVERERIRQLEAADEVTEPALAIADPGAPLLSGSADTIAALIAARDVERERIRHRDNDIRLLVTSNKALRREAQALRVRGWRDAETIADLERELEKIAALETELEQAHRARSAASRRGRQLAHEIETLRARPWYPFADWLSSRPPSTRTEFGRRQILTGDGPFFQRGFFLGEAAAIAGTTVKRIKAAPSGMLVFGPYVKLAAGTYAVTIDARLYQRMPVLTNFRIDIVGDGALQIFGERKFFLNSMAGWRKFELIFTVWDGEDYPDFEIRIWARKGTPLEIGRIDLFRLVEEPPAASVATADANGGAASS